jgi:predicted alpha/beta superfamily hydrolase
VYVYLPEEAIEDPQARFPVLYMFDGHNVFFDEDATYGKSWGMGEYLERTRTGLIVVAVDCNHRPPHGRLNEYSPYTFDDPWFGHITGYGRRFMRWLVETLKPLIDEAIVDMVTTGVTEEKLRAFAERAKTAGSEEYRSIYQEIYTRWTSAE